MSLDEVKQQERQHEVIDLDAVGTPDLRHGIEIADPSDNRRLPALLRKARERLDWTQIPRLPQRSAKPASLAKSLAQRFGLFVLLPTAIVAAYLFLIASDQYVAEARFAIRGNVEPMGNAALGEFTSLIRKHNSQDSFVIKEFIGSQNMVEQLEKAIGVSTMFAKPSVDLWARYWGPQPIEELTKYWNHQVATHIDVISGIITLNVRAFTREDALTIAKEVVERSEKLINEISRRAQADMVRQ